MYNNGLNPSFIKKQAYLSVFVFWFCACLVLYTVNKTFFEYDYSKTRDYGLSTNNIAILNYKERSDTSKIFLSSYENISSGVAIVYGKVASFSQMLIKKLCKKPSFYTTCIILLIPYLISFLIILSISTYLSVMKIVSATSLSSFIISFSIIFDAFAGNENIDFIIAYSAPQVAAYATINLFLFFLISFPFCFCKKREEI